MNIISVEPVYNNVCETTSAFADVSYLMADVEVIFFCIKMYWTPAQILLLADDDEFNFANAGIKWPLTFVVCPGRWSFMTGRINMIL